MPNLKPSIPYPSRRDDERRREQANEQIEKFYEIFKDMSFEISFTDALILMPKFASTLKALIGNKEKLSEMARTPMNEHCSMVILNKLSKKLGDPGKFLILCEFLGMDECLALADLGASINLMPLSVWKELSLPELTPTCMTLELADRSVSKPIGIAKDVKVKVGMFHFPADFVVVDFEPDPRVPLILRRCFLKTGRALIDVHKGELTLRIENEAITYNLDQTSRYSANYDQMTANKIDVTDEACEEYFQEVLGFSNITASGSPSDDPIVSPTSHTLTPFGDSDFLLFEEANAFLGLEDDPDSPELDPSYYDPEGDIEMLEAILNSDPTPSLPNHEQSVPSFTNELKACEAQTIKSSVDEPPESSSSGHVSLLIDRTDSKVVVKLLLILNITFSLPTSREMDFLNISTLAYAVASNGLPRMMGILRLFFFILSVASSAARASVIPELSVSCFSLSENPELEEKFRDEEDDLEENLEDPKECEEDKANTIIEAIHDKLNDDWFNNTSKDEDDLEGILYYLEPRSYDGFINLDDEAYNKSRCKLLGMTYKEPTLILIEKVKVTRYTIGPGEIYIKVKVLEVYEIPRTRDNVAAIRARLMEKMAHEGNGQAKT
nr:reverse transcriptase domain-containing protein [Tanacetum cinerariifolium]